MALGRRKPKQRPIDEPDLAGAHRKREAPVENPVADDADGPFDLEDFDDSATATEGRLDLGSVLLPIPASAQLQVELTDAGVVSLCDGGGMVKELRGLTHFACAPHPILVVFALALSANTCPGGMEFGDLLVDGRL